MNFVELRLLKLRLDIGIEFDASFDDIDRIKASHKTFDLDLLVFERFVIFEEPFHGFQPMPR